MNQPDQDHLPPADRQRVNELKALLNGTEIGRELNALFGLDEKPTPPPPTEEKDQ